MRRFRQILPILCSLSLAAMVMACSSTPAPVAEAPKLYHVGGAAFDLRHADVLQTWPIIQYETPLRFARVTVQMPPDALVAGLPKDAGRLQIDILAPDLTLKGDAVIAARFTDWQGREVAPAGSRYHYDPQSSLLKDGGRKLYQRSRAATGLDMLAPVKPRDRAPIFFVPQAVEKTFVAIECREDVPPSANTGEYCSLQQQVNEFYAYRIWFPRSLLPSWPKIDTAARNYLARAALDQWKYCLTCLSAGN